MILTIKQISRLYPHADIREGAVIGEGAFIGEGAVIRARADIEKRNEGIVLHGAYKYSAGAYYDSKKKEIIIRLGCSHRSISEWDADFDNNLQEFPRDSEEWKKRWNTFQILRTWAIENLPNNIE